MIKKEIPLLMQTEMVEAILAGRKTMTRRTTGLNEVNKNPDNVEFLGFQDYRDGSLRALFQSHDDDESGSIKCPYGRVGDFLWVRETFSFALFADGERYLYRATDDQWRDHRGNPAKWKPSIHMPKEAARIWLEVTDIRVERLRDISKEDAIAEGIEPAESFDSGEGLYPGRFFKNYLPHGYTEVLAKDSFQSLWTKINGPESWDQNPFVWVIEFKVLSTTGKPENIESCTNTKFT